VLLAYVFIWHNNDNNNNNNDNNNNNNIRVSIMLICIRDRSRVSTVSTFCWFYRFKVVIRVKDIIFDKLTILFLVNYRDFDYGVYNKSCKVLRVF